MHAVPRLASAPRAGALAVVAALHVAIAAGLLLVRDVRERLIERAPMVVQLHAAPRERPPESRPLPLPAFEQPRRIEMPVPVVAVAPEIAIAPPREPAPSITGAVASTEAPVAPPAPASIEPPRFDMAYLRNPAPAYPPVSRRLKEQGRVLLHVLVTSSGDAQQVEVRTSSGSERLDQAAMEAVRRWRFVPAKRGAEAVSAWALVPINFQLDA